MGELRAALHRGCRKEMELVLGIGLNFPSTTGPVSVFSKDSEGDRTYAGMREIALMQG